MKTSTNRTQMIKRIAKFGLIVMLGISLCACSKTVQWEEEVPLNTGETIIVKRTVLYALKGGAGNPFDIAYRPDANKIIEFAYAGKNYHYDGDAAILLIAISPQNKPVLVAEAETGAWYAKHNYQCTVPFYVQFVPDMTGQSWTWPPQIETWLFNIKPNLLLDIPTPTHQHKYFTARNTLERNAQGLFHSPSRRTIAPDFAGDLCGRKGK